jgi:acyl carrier protein
MPDSLAPDDVLAELQPIFRDALDEPNLKLTLKSNASNTPNWDSLAHIDIIERVERRFKVRFGLGELQDLQETGDIVRLVIEKTARR